MDKLGVLAASRNLRSFAVLGILVASTASGSERINKDSDNIAIRGYDTVAYFTQGRAVKGSPDFEQVWQDARWLFATDEHRKLFSSDPDSYAPQFGGFCTGGVGLGHLAPIDPEAWVIVQGRLYLHYDKESRDETAAEPTAHITAAVDRWDALGKTP
jgi:hypothetical protein